MRERSQERGDERRRILEIYRKERHDEREVSDGSYRRHRGEQDPLETADHERHEQDDKARVNLMGHLWKRRLVRNRGSLTKASVISLLRENIVTVRLWISASHPLYRMICCIHNVSMVISIYARLLPTYGSSLTIVSLQAIILPRKYMKVLQVSVVQAWEILSAEAPECVCSGLLARRPKHIFTHLAVPIVSILNMLKLSSSRRRAAGPLHREDSDELQSLAPQF